MHKYDHNCTCDDCRQYEFDLEARVQRDRRADRAIFDKVRKERASQQGFVGQKEK
jgi:hypothetical protein